MIIFLEIISPKNQFNLHDPIWMFFWFPARNVSLIWAYNSTSDVQPGLESLGDLEPSFGGSQQVLLIPAPTSTPGQLTVINNL